MRSMKLLLTAVSISVRPLLQAGDVLCVVERMSLNSARNIVSLEKGLTGFETAVDYKLKLKLLWAFQLGATAS